MNYLWSQLIVFRILYTCLLLSTLSTKAWAILPPPPVISQADVQLTQYMKQLYDNHNKLDVVTTDPNGNRIGKVGDIVIYNNSGVYTINVNTDGDKAWSAL